MLAILGSLTGKTVKNSAIQSLLGLVVLSLSTFAKTVVSCRNIVLDDWLTSIMIVSFIKNKLKY